MIYYALYMTCVTTAYMSWNWWYLYPAQPEWIRLYEPRDIPEQMRRYRLERRLTLAVTVLTLVATNGTMLAVTLIPR